MKKALLAVQSPYLCDICSSLATDQNVLQALFSEQGYSHHGFGYLEKSAGKGCGLCRLLLLQDPNPNWQRRFEPLTLFAEREEGLEAHSDGSNIFVVLHFCTGDVYVKAVGVRCFR